MIWCSKDSSNNMGHWSVMTLRAYSCQSSTAWTQSTLIKWTERWRNMREIEKRMSKGRRAEETGPWLSQTNSSLFGLSLKSLSSFSLSLSHSLFPLHALLLYQSCIPFPVPICLVLFFHFLSLEITTHSVHTIYAIESLYRPIWGMVVLGHSWHNPLLPPHVRYTRHCAEWMRRSSQCTRTRALSVPGTASKSMRPHNTPPPVICH